MSKKWEDDHPADQSDLAKENATLRAHLLNVLGKLEVTENFIPRVTMDLASQHGLELEDTNAGSWARRKITHHCGS
jgi:hypothetical protein